TQLPNLLDQAIAQRSEANEAQALLRDLLDQTITQRNEQKNQTEAIQCELSNERAQIEWIKEVLPPKFFDRNYPGTDQIPLYLKLFGAPALIDRTFYNIGSGWNRHALWTNVDHPSEWYASVQADNLDLAWDISSGRPIEVESGKAKIAYTSHTIEHLLNEHVQHMFNEVHR